MLHEYTAMPSSVTLITAVLNLQAVQMHCYAQHSMHHQNWPAKLLVPAPVAACQTGRFPPFHQVSCQDCWHPFLHSESAENPVQAVADLHLRHYNLAVPLWVQQLAVYSETHCYLLPYYAYNQCYSRASVIWGRFSKLPKKTVSSRGFREAWNSGWGSQSSLA